MNPAITFICNSNEHNVPQGWRWGVFPSGCDSGKGHLLKTSTARNARVQEQHFLIRKAILYQKDVNENSDERAGGRGRTMPSIHIDGSAKKFGKITNAGKKSNKNKKSIRGDYENSRRRGAVLLLYTKMKHRGPSISIFVKTDVQSEREQEHANISPSSDTNVLF